MSFQHQIRHVRGASAQNP